MSERDLSIDNVRLVLIILVALGHIIEPLIGNHAFFKTVYLFIYLFHIPLFVAISGYVASSRPSKEKQHKYVPFGLAIGNWPGFYTALQTPVMPVFEFWFYVSGVTILMASTGHSVSQKPQAMHLRGLARIG